MVVGAMIGRFQPFHLGHLHAVKYCLSKTSELVIILGSALTSHTVRNPFTSRERIQMITLALTEAKIPREKYTVIPVPDIRKHSLWVSLVESLTPPFSIVFSNDSLTQILFKERGYDVREIPLLKREIFSGEEFRRRVIRGEDWAKIVSSSVAKFLEEKNLLERVIELSE